MPIKETPLSSYLGDDVFLPKTIEEFPLVHYLELADNVKVDYNPDVLSCKFK